MVTSYLQGGLGNQIFQVAAAYNLAKKNKDVAEFNFNQSHTPNQGKESKFYKNNIFREFNHNNDLTIEHVYNQNQHSFKEIPYLKNLLLKGFFQSEKFFLENKDEIIEKLLIGLYSENDKKNNIESFLKEIKQNNLPLVSVHIRRGDYLKYLNIHGICSETYYDRAFQTMESKIGKFIPIFISDDKEWIKNKFKKTISPFFDDLEELILMTMCDHNIIANSSFSWWGAYLNSNKNKIVIGPKSWFGVDGPKDQGDTIPIEWIKL